MFLHNPVLQMMSHIDSDRTAKPIPEVLVFCVVLGKLAYCSVWNENNRGPWVRCNHHVWHRESIWPLKQKWDIFIDLATNVTSYVKGGI